MNFSQRVENLATHIAIYIKEIIFFIKETVLPRLLPEGGVTGQILIKTDGGYSWVDAPTTNTNSNAPTAGTPLFGTTLSFTTQDGYRITVQDGIIVGMHDIIPDSEGTDPTIDPTEETPL